MLNRDEILAVSLAILTALMVTMLAVLAGTLETPQQAQGTTPEPTCAEWTDGCVVCARTAQGLACSTPGIACVPKAPHCLKP
ncbi:MAG TPA: hypothetical protein VEZ24_01110 [Microvirga sp.]|nr:hypothetical protein [Microvirga sp.]